MRALIFALAVLAGCLPDPDQPVPGSVRVTVVSDEALSEGFTTADGWRIEYDEALLAIGFVRLWSDLERSDGQRCYAAHEYSTEYARVIDMRRPGEQLIATPYGLGPCEIGLQIWGGSDTTLPGAGLGQSDLDELRRSQGPVSMVIAGHASRGAVEKRFEWPIHEAFDFERCVSIMLERGAPTSVVFQLTGAALFRADSDAEPSFDELAAADTDDDGLITLDEIVMSGLRQRLFERAAAILVPPDPKCEARPLRP
jgi:hypothetical protein